MRSNGPSNKSLETLRCDDDAPPLSFPAEMVDEIEEALVDAVKAGSKEVSGMLGIDFSTPPEKAVAFARERAAEMVGMKRLDDGSLVPNPNARWRIDEDLRATINEKVRTAIEKGWSPQELKAALGPEFEPWRAETIARTETGEAYGEGAAAVYSEEGIDHVEIIDGEGCLPEGHKDGAPKPEPDLVGVVQAEKQANGQIWTVEQFRARLLGHPNCVRDTVPYIASGEN